MNLGIDISEHNKNVIDRFVDGEGFEILPAPIVDDVVRAVRNGKPIVHGKWLNKDYGVGDCSAECSVCGKETEGMAEDTNWGYDYSFYNFCPNCGADMRGNEEC